MMMMRQRIQKQQRGFSLVEVLVAIALIMIVSGMAIINFGSVLPNAKANSAMDQMLYQLRSARARAIAHRREVQVQFVGTNQMTITEIATIGAAPPPTTVSFEGGAKYLVFGSVPDIPAPYNFGNTQPIFFGGLAGGPPVMKFTTNGSFIDGGNSLVNGTVFLGITGNARTARAVSILGATGRVREYHWDGTQWQE
jgi:prepilin-type N-terminal cleavage/methylation domain-containing protein